jgi:hypothetical protein
MQQQGKLRIGDLPERLARETRSSADAVSRLFHDCLGLHSLCPPEPDVIGRPAGLAAGSLVSYCLKITDIDPIQYGSRLSASNRPPDAGIDIDFGMNGRGQVINYVTWHAAKTFRNHFRTIRGRLRTRAGLACPTPKSIVLQN